MVDLAMDRWRGRHLFLGGGQDDGLGEKKQGGLQHGGAVFVSRTAVMVVRVRGITLLRFGGGVRWLAVGEALFHGGNFQMLDEVEDRRKAQQHDPQSDEKEGVLGLKHGAELCLCSRNVKNLAGGRAMAGLVRLLSRRTYTFPWQCGEIGLAWSMTLANQLTVLRILLIPVFVFFSISYGQSLDAGRPLEWQRVAAILVFIFAAVTDGLDGYIARHWNQRSRLGAVLDPIADKGLLLTAIVTLSLGNWNQAFPLWFPVLVIARDAVILAGCGVLYFLNGALDVKPTWTGKAATAAQMVAIAWMMLQLPHYLASVYAAGILTLVSGVDYLIQGSLQARHHAKPHSS